MTYIYIIYNIYVIMKTMCPPGYAHLASVTFEHSVCRRSLMTTYIIYNIYNIMQYIYIYVYMRLY